MLFNTREPSDQIKYGYDPEFDNLYARIASTAGWHEENDSEYADWKRVRSAMEHENYLLFERAKLLTATQAFFFVAYAMILTSDEFKSNASALFLLFLISIAALSTSWFISIGMYEAKHQHKKLERWWRTRIGDPISSENLKAPERRIFPIWFDKPFCYACLKSLNRENFNESRKSKVVTGGNESGDLYQYDFPSISQSWKRKLRHPPICGTDPRGGPFKRELLYHRFADIFVFIWVLTMLYNFYMLFK